MKRSAVAIIALLLAGCAESDNLAPPMQADLLHAEPTFYRFEETAFAAAEKSGSFWAVKGQERELVLRYTDTGEELLHFRVGPNSLTSLSPDSVQITVAVDAGGAFIFRFEPSGLKFNGDAPARLTLSYARATIDANLIQLATAGIWKQELPILPWLKLPTVNLFGSEKAYTDVHDFTGFGMATN